MMAYDGELVAVGAGFIYTGIVAGTHFLGLYGIEWARLISGLLLFIGIVALTLGILGAGMAMVYHGVMG